MSWLVTLAASSRVMPLIISVRAEAEAMALAQPKVLNLASSMWPLSSSLKVSLRASPQAMLPTRADAVGVFHLPDVAGVEEMVHDLVRIFPHEQNPLSNW